MNRSTAGGVLVAGLLVAGLSAPAAGATGSRGPAATSLSNGSTERAIDRAAAAVAAYPVALRATSADAFRSRSVLLDRDGTSHVRYDRTYRGLPVLGGDVVVH